MDKVADKLIKSVLEPVTSARAVFKALHKPVAALMTEGVAFYEAAFKPIDKMLAKKHAEQDARLFDLINNVNMDSADARKLVQRGNVDVIGALSSAFGNPMLLQFVSQIASTMDEEPEKS